VPRKAKGLTRPITRSHARSYDKTFANPGGRPRLGVTHLAELNGPGAYDEYHARYEATRRLLTNNSEADQVAYTAKQRAAMKKMSPARQRAFKKMLVNAPAISSVRRRKGKRKATANKAKAGRGRVVSGASWHKVVAKKKAAPAKRTTTKRKMAAKRKTTRRKKKLTAAQRRAISMKNLRKAWKAKGVKVKRGRQTRTYGQRKSKKTGRKTGGYRALRARYGPRSRWTYKYTTKKGSIRDIPDHALLGYPSAAAMRKVYKTGSERERAALGRKLQRLHERRERDAEKAAARIRAGRGMFTPNKADVLSYEEWEEMRPNARRKKTTKKKATSSRKPKYGTKAYYKWLGRKGAAARKRKGGGSKKKTTARRKKAAVGRKPKYGTKAYYKWLGRKGAAARKRKGGGKRKATTRRKPARRKTMTITLRANRKRRRVRKNQGSYASNRRRRARRRTYRRNQGFVQQLGDALKLGALVTAGFATHRALTHVIDTHALGKIEALQTGEIAKYRGIISGFLTAALGIGGVMATAKGGSKWQAPVAAGMAASFIHGAIVTALSAAGQQEAAAYLSNYPNAEGSMYGHGIGSYYEFSPHQVYSGYGSYYEIPQPMSGFGQPMLTQAAAGYGQLTQAAAGMGNPMLTQAAAGMGQITQAAAGTGEYVAVGIQGIGEYEETPVSGVASYVDEGIHPNLHSAEQALSVAEAAAGVGSADVPLQSTVNPTMIADPISDLPQGSRAGILAGGDGIFG
jgi:hypothetical protein